MVESRMSTRQAAGLGFVAASLLLLITVPMLGFQGVSRTELTEKKSDFWKDEEGLFGVEGKAWEHSPDETVRAAQTAPVASALTKTKLVSASKQAASQPATTPQHVAAAQHVLAKQTMASKPSKHATEKKAASEKRSLPAKKPLGDFSVPVEYKGVNVGRVYNKAWKAAFDAAYSSAYNSAMQGEEDRLWKQARQGEKARKELDQIERERETGRKIHPQSILAATEGEDSDSTTEESEEGQQGEEEEEPEAEETAEEESEDGSPKKAITWDAVPLGAKQHMHEGPEYTNGKERYGALQVHCAMGNCENLERAGVNVDSWKGLMFGKVPRTVPWPGFDPSEDPVTKVAMNTRTGRFAKYNKGRADDGVAWGGGPESQSYVDPTAERLEKHGVKVDSEMAHVLYAGFPLPAWDKSQYDHVGKSGRSPFYSAEEALKRNRESDQALEAHGVAVNRLPSAKLGKPYAHADGIPDRLVKNQQLPYWRTDGAMSDAEQPNSFLLRDDSAEHMNTPQWQENDQGVEVKGAPQTELQGDLSRAGVLVDHWPGHVAGKTASTWCSKDSWDCTSTNPTRLQ